MTNVISGRPHIKTDIWDNNGLIDNGTFLHTVYYILDKLDGLIAVAAL